MIEEEQKKESATGTKLRQARERLKYSLIDVSSATKIRQAQLDAIEKGNIETLPGMTYAIGFVKVYAKYLELDENVIAEEFKAEHVGEEKKPELAMNVSEAEISKPYPKILILSTILAVGLLIIWAIFSGDDVQVAEVREVKTEQIAVSEVSQDSRTDGITEENAELLDIKEEDEALEEELIVKKTEETHQLMIEKKKEALANEEDHQRQLEEEIEIKKAKLEARQKEKPNVAKISGVVIKSSQASWIQVSDANGNTVFKKVLRPGDLYAVPKQKGMRMLTANAGGIDIYIDGKKLNKLGGKGAVIRGIFLDPSELISRYKFE